MPRSIEDGRPKIPNYAKFLIGGMAGVGGCIVCQPIDVIKNRMQLSGEGGKAREHKTSLHAVKNIVQSEGVLALYDGLTANIARQLAYTMTRLGLYQITVDQLAASGITGLNSHIFSGLFAGGIAAMVATPTDVALIRMTADGRLPAKERRNYKHVIDALIRIGKEEGAQGLWAGVGPTVLRAMVGTASQLVSYVHAKQYLLRNELMKDNLGCHFTASVISGFFYAFITTPLDVAKTRIQNMKIINGKPEYSGMLNVWIQILKNEGVPALWKGFGPYYFRIAPNTILLFIFMEKLTKWYKIYVLKDPTAEGGL
ncbi:hypothetical protein O3M35_007398 [Rhynocoris fuscipes]|uniref:Mitochondrial 2-oxoglutarate/malate carrier protein n=1 Tax=Rhynocoris fuscipes TaxID=488301 RepID=A0AAW1D9Y0_9HEMI